MVCPVIQGDHNKHVV